MTIYEQGILHVTIFGLEKERFRISDYDGVQWEQLQPDSSARLERRDGSVVISSRDHFDNIKYVINLSPFKILLFINETLILKAND